MTNEQKAIIYRQLLAKAKRQKSEAEQALIEADCMIEIYQLNLDKALQHDRN